ncbi:hypothetical protein BU15DRAFT_90655 [Melanogaster broomeanus]|nr:hypothetical protein BU15DRAFT_90655 [Melanogaster broomeanus]
MKSRHRARNIPDLAEELNSPELPTLIHCFLYDQLHATHIDLRLMCHCGNASLQGRVDVFHSALATFFAPSDLSGTGGMHHEHIRATPSCTDSINGMDIAESSAFFLPIPQARRSLCIGSRPDNTTGLWMVHPSFEDDGLRELSVIHLDTIFHAVHLLPIFGNSDSIHPAVNLHNSLDTFKGYYVNKFC